MLDILLYDGFGAHAADGAGYAAELEAALQDEVPDKHLVQFAKVAAHTVGEHLGDWPRASQMVGRLLADRAPGRRDRQGLGPSARGAAAGRRRRRRGAGRDRLLPRRGRRTSARRRSS